MTFDDKVTAITQEELIPKVVDNVLNSNVLTARILGNAKEGKGYDIRKPLKYKSSGTATSFAGLDTFSAAQLNTKVKMIFDMRAVRIPVAIAGMDRVANSTADSKVDLVKETLEEVEQELADYIGGLMYGDGTGNSNKDYIGLGALVDDGTSVTTIGSLSRTTYPVLDATKTASGGTVTLAKMGTLTDAASSGSAKFHTNLFVTTKAIWSLYEQLLTPTVRENYQMTGMPSIGASGGMTQGQGLQGQGGFVALSFRGVPICKDEKCTTGNLYGLNENYLDFYGWDAKGEEGYNTVALGSSLIDGVYEEAPMSEFHGFNWSGLRSSLSQFGTIGELNQLGNLTSWSPKRQAVLTGITGI
jgi:hypothetical protein